jgi:hypothetical protein
LSNSYAKHKLRASMGNKRVDEGSVLQFVTINVKIYASLISTFGKRTQCCLLQLLYSAWLYLAFSAFLALHLCRKYEWNCWSSVDELLFKSSRNRTTMRQDGMESISLLMIAVDLLRQINFEDVLIGCCFTSIQKFFNYIMASSS